MFSWFRRRKVDDTQPIPVVSADKELALQVLDEARSRRQEAQALNAVIADKAGQLAAKKEENHFYQSFITILRTE